MAFRTRLNDSFDRHLLLEVGPLSHRIYEKKIHNAHGTYFICLFRSSSFIDGSFSIILLTTSIIAKVLMGLLKILINFLSRPRVSQNGLFTRRYRKSNARWSCSCPSSHYPPTSVGFPCMVRGISVPDKTGARKTREAKPVPHQDHLKDHDHDYKSCNAP